MVMAPPRHSPKRVQRRAQQLQERQREEAERRRSRQGDADKEPAARRSLDKDAPSFGKGDLPQVDLRDDPTTPDGEVTDISCYGGRLQSLSQIVGISRFANLRSLCVHGCRLTRMDVDPMLRACGDSLRDLNLSSNRLARLEGLPVLRNLRTLDVTNNAIVSLDGIDLGAPKLSRLVARYNRVRSLHALTIPRADGQPWSLAHLDIRDNNVETFADLGAGLAAVVSLRAILLRSSPSPFGSFEPSSDADDPVHGLSSAPPSTTDSLEATAGSGEDVGTRGRRVGTPVCLEPSYRLAIAALAPWLRELDGEPLSRGPDELAEGSGAVADARNADLLERAAREAAETAETAALARSAAEAAREGKEARVGKESLDLSFAAADESPENFIASDDSAAARRNRTTPKMDEALTRYNDRAVGQGRSGRSPAKRDHREVTFALTDEILQALDDDGVSTKAAEGSVASAEPDPPEPTNDAAATAAARDETDEDEQDARVERKRAKKRDRKERERRRAETDEADAAVVDHELRLRRIERDLLRAANARREAAGGVHAAEVASTQRGVASTRGEVVSTQTSVSLSRGALAHPPPKPQSGGREQLEAEVSALKSQVEALLRERDPRGKGSGSGARPDWQHPGRRATIPSTPPPVRGNQPQQQQQQQPGADDVEVGAGADDGAEGAEGAEGTDYADAETRVSSSPAKRLATAAEREAELARKLAAARAEVTAERERHALETQMLKDDHAKSVDASTRAAKEATEARDVALKSLSEHPASVDAAELDRVNAELVSALAVSEELEATLREVREEAAANLDALRAMHARECQLRDENLVAANNLTRKVVQDLADSKTARDALESEVRRVNERVKAVEDEFRWALKESEEDKTRLTAEVEEMTRVARAALDGKRDAEALAEELAEVCEQQRVAIEDMARDRRRAERAEADAAAARADVGEMQVRIREAEKRASAAVAAERAATKALDLVKDQKAQSIAAIAEVDGVRKQLELAHDNVRIKDAMLESQAELIKSLKDENARNKEATSGAVKAAVDAERAASSRAKSTENDLHRLKKDLAGADAAIERLEKALEEVTARRDAAEDAAADARREIAERDQMLAYVSSEVESVKSMFAQREDGLRRERDDALARLAERDDADDELKAEARAAREDAAAARADAAEAAAAAEARVASIDERERAATEKVRRVEAEMRALLQEVAQHKRQSQAKVQELMALI